MHRLDCLKRKSVANSLIAGINFCYLIYVLQIDNCPVGSKMKFAQLVRNAIKELGSPEILICISGAPELLSVTRSTRSIGILSVRKLSYVEERKEEYFYRGSGSAKLLISQLFFSQTNTALA